MTCASILSLILINLQNRTYFEQRQYLITAPSLALVGESDGDFIIQDDRINLIFQPNNKQLVLVGSEPDPLTIMVAFGGPFTLILCALVTLYIHWLYKKVQIVEDNNHDEPYEEFDLYMNTGRGY